MNPSLRAAPRILLPILCLLLGTAAARCEEEWKDYTNARFGFRLSYPATLKPSRAPENGDGREFHTPNKEFSIAAFAHFLLKEDGDSLEKRWQEELKDLGKTITYKKKAAMWYVVSGVAKDGTEYYHKTYVKDGNWCSFHITYPHSKNKHYDPWVAKIENAFVPFLEGDYDRIVE
jgi:hypothetical protein